MDWFLYDNDLRRERVKKAVQKNISQSSKFLFFINFQKLPPKRRGNNVKYFVKVKDTLWFFFFFSEYFVKYI